MHNIGRMIRDNEGRLTHAVGISLDISERKQIEDKLRTLNETLEQRVWERTAELELVNDSLRESESRLRQLAENINEVFWMSDPAKQEMLYISPVYERVWGRSCASLSAAPLSWSEAIHPDDRSRVLAALPRQITGGYDEEYRIVRPDGDIRWIRDRAFPVRDRAGKTYRVVGVAEDITARKQAEEELIRLPHRIIEAQEAERTRVSRELHDGVNQIIASARMRLNKVESDPSQLRPATRTILTRCNELLVQALEENRRIARNLHPIELDELGLVAAARKLCRDFETRTNVTMKCHFAEMKRRLLPAFELNLFRILQEALTNIEKHARATDVHVRFIVRDGAITLTIKDNGRGFRVTTGKERRKGDGIGLSNMRERASAMGGVCQLVSAPKQGTSVTVSAVCPKEANPTSPNTKTEVGPGSARGSRAESGGPPDSPQPLAS
jgi:PAS domain S-box-containing protein